MRAHTHTHTHTHTHRTPLSVATPSTLLQSPETGNPENAIFETKNGLLGVPLDPFK